MLRTRILAVFALALIMPTGVSAQSGNDHSSMDHSSMKHSEHVTVQTPVENGQSAFAAIAEIVNLLRADPGTEWAQVNIDALRAHLVDMDAVTLHADVTAIDTDRGAIFDVTSTDPKVTEAIRRMVLAHGQTMSGVDGMDMHTLEIPSGAQMEVTGPDPLQIRALGFFGVMTLGMHHQAHHMALALGSDPHHN